MQRLRGERYKAYKRIASEKQYSVVVRNTDMSGTISHLSAV